MSTFKFAVHGLVAMASICLVSCGRDNKPLNAHDSSVTPSPMGHKNPVGVKGLGFEFDGDANAEGWTVTHDAELSVSGGSLILRIAGTDPGIVSANNLGVDTSLYGYIAIRMRTRGVDPDDIGQVFATTSSTGDFVETLSETFKVGSSGTWQTLVLDVSADPGWTGTVQRIRIDPCYRSISSVFEIDWIRFLSSPISEN